MGPKLSQKLAQITGISWVIALFHVGFWGFTGRRLLGPPVASFVLEARTARTSLIPTHAHAHRGSSVGSRQAMQCPLTFPESSLSPPESFRLVIEVLACRVVIDLSEETPVDPRQHSAV